MKRENGQNIFRKRIMGEGKEFPNPMNRNHPLLLFVTTGYDDEKKMYFVRINGIRNPLPFKEAYGISYMHLVSWLKSHGWEIIGQRDATLFDCD